MFPDYLSVFYDYVSIQKSMERCFVELNLKRTNWVVQSDLYNPDRNSISAHLDLISCGLDLHSSKLNNYIIVDSWCQFSSNYYEKILWTVKIEVWKNIIKESTYCQNLNTFRDFDLIWIIDLILYNKTKSFQRYSVIDTGLFGFLKM